MADLTCRLVTLGCKVNQYETQLVKEALQRSGYREALADEAADLCVVNTCTVTAEADSKARQSIRQLARRNPGTKTVVFGCYAAHAAAELERLPNVVAVVAENRELPDVFQRFGVLEWPSGVTRFDGHRRAFVKVQDGCVLRCTYCIIPKVRPGLRSRDPETIVAEVRALIEAGYREIVLTGIHLGHYGVETSRGDRPRFRLPHLIRRLNDLPGNWRLRLSSLEAAEVNAEFLDHVADCHRLSPHFHICLQSGSDAVLARMRRRYRSTRFLENVAAIAARFDRPALSTDVIVGFPGETDDDFEATLRVCEMAGFMKIHIFPFSPRRGTAAFDFPDQIPPHVQHERSDRLRELETRLAARYYASLVGVPLNVLVEARPASRPDHVLGTACRYAAVELPGTSADVGQLIPVRIDSYLGQTLLGHREPSA